GPRAGRPPVHGRRSAPAGLSSRASGADRQEHAAHVEALRQRDLERISPHARRRRTHEGQAAGAIVEGGGDYEGGAPARLLVPRLRIEAHLDEVAAFRNEDAPRPHHTSRPTAGPKSGRSGRLRLVIFATSSRSVYRRCRRSGTRTTVPASCRTSSGVPCARAHERATSAGMRTARLFPHFCTRRRITPLAARIYMVYRCRLGGASCHDAWFQVRLVDHGAL